MRKNVEPRARGQSFGDEEGFAFDGALAPNFYGCVEPKVIVVEAADLYGWVFTLVDHVRGGGRLLAGELGIIGGLLGTLEADDGRDGSLVKVPEVLGRRTMSALRHVARDGASPRSRATARDEATLLATASALS